MDCAPDVKIPLHCRETGLWLVLKKIWLYHQSISHFNMILASNAHQLHWLMLSGSDNATNVWNRSYSPQSVFLSFSPSSSLLLILNIAPSPFLHLYLSFYLSISLWSSVPPGCWSPALEWLCGPVYHSWIIEKSEGVVSQAGAVRSNRDSRSRLTATGLLYKRISEAARRR